jgi:hypothetical protein
LAISLNRFYFDSRNCNSDCETVLSNIYGKEHIEEEKPFSVNLDGDVWIIEGSLYYRKGGVAYMEIRKSDGKILKVIHTK